MQSKIYFIFVTDIGQYVTICFHLFHFICFFSPCWSLSNTPIIAIVIDGGKKNKTKQNMKKPNTFCRLYTICNDNDVFKTVTLVFMSSSEWQGMRAAAEKSHWWILHRTVLGISAKKGSLFGTEEVQVDLIHIST